MLWIIFWAWIVIAVLMFIISKFFNPNCNYDWMAGASLFMLITWIIVGGCILAYVDEKKAYQNKYETYRELKGGTLSFEDWKRLYDYDKPKNTHTTTVMPMYVR